MRIISTNIGKARDIEWNGKIVRTGIFKFPVDEPLFLGNEDVENDEVIDRRYHGGTEKACYLYSADHYSYWKQFYSELEMPYGIFGENLTIEGLHEAQINIGDVFDIGDAVVQATQPRQPCFKLEFRFPDPAIVRRFVDSGFPGVYVRILKNGSVKNGDLVRLTKRQDSISVQKVFQLLYATEFDREAVEIAVNDPFIAQSCRNDLLKRWGAYLS